MNGIVIFDIYDSLSVTWKKKSKACPVVYS